MNIAKTYDGRLAYETLWQRPHKTVISGEVHVGRCGQRVSVPPPFHALTILQPQERKCSIGKEVRGETQITLESHSISLNENVWKIMG